MRVKRGGFRVSLCSVKKGGGSWKVRGAKGLRERVEKWPLINGRKSTTLRSTGNDS